jgi:hypothetical protein
MPRSTYLIGNYKEYNIVTVSILSPRFYQITEHNMKATVVANMYVDGMVYKIWIEDAP